MSERYLITGVQIGMLKMGVDPEKVLKEVEDSQFLGHSGTPVSLDADMIFNSGLYGETKDDIHTEDIIDFKVKYSKGAKK